MSDKLLKDGLRDSRKVGAVSVFAELLFVRLLLASCPLGRCPASPDWIHKNALPNRPRTRLQSIAEALTELLTARLVIRYTGPDGTAYLSIPLHGQRFKHAVRSPWPPPPAGPPDAEGQIVMAMDDPPPRETRPPARVSSVTHFSSLSDSSKRAPARDNRLASDCLDELATLFPRHDVPMHLRAAERYVRKERGPEAEVTVGWFVVHWMPGAAEKKEREVHVQSETAAQREEREAIAARFDAEQAAKIAAIVNGPEPERGTLEHAIWLEGRKSA